MFSNDKNIETIGQLVKLVKENFLLQKEYVKLDATEKTVKLITALTLFAILFLVILAILTYLSFAAVFAMAPSVGYPVAFCIVAAIYILLFIILYIFRKDWIERPLVKFITNLLMN
ncbi:MAG: phage holin family protein [Prevotella sp.]|nr:phage holin family protein [Prevotella sp.]